MAALLTEESSTQLSHKTDSVYSRAIESPEEGNGGLSCL